MIVKIHTSKFQFPPRDTFIHEKRLYARKRRLNLTVAKTEHEGDGERKEGEKRERLDLK